MSIFIDACIFIAYVNEKDRLHAQTSGLIEASFDGRFDGIVARIGD